jgi:hypothetical protein
MVGMQDLSLKNISKCINHSFVSLSFQVRILCFTQIKSVAFFAFGKFFVSFSESLNLTNLAINQLGL